MSSSAKHWSLAQLQDCLHMIATDARGLPHAIERARQQHGARLPVRVPNGVPVETRLAVYARGYITRLSSCMEADFPALRALLGEEMFDKFVTAYLSVRPSRHYSLFELGAAFADYLESTCPAPDVVAPEQRSLLRLPIDLARAERARLEVTRARGVERELELEVPDGLGPLLGDDVALCVTPCLRVIALDHDVRAFLEAVDRGATPGYPEPRKTVLAFSRADYRVVSAELTPWQHQVLIEAHTPRSLCELASHVSEHLGEPRSAVLADLWLWIPVAVSTGLVSLSSASKAQHSQ